MELPQILKVNITKDGSPARGALLSLTLHTGFKNDFSSIWGPSDRDGNLTIRRDQLIKEGERDKNLFLMDYGHPESDFNGRITLKVMNEESIQRAHAAYTQLSKSYDYPEGYEQTLRDGLKSCVANAKLEAVCIGSQPTLIIEN